MFRQKFRCPHDFGIDGVVISVRPKRCDNNVKLPVSSDGSAITNGEDFSCIGVASIIYEKAAEDGCTDIDV